jgi:hypothetical protein
VREVPLVLKVRLLGAAGVFSLLRVLLLGVVESAGLALASSWLIMGERGEPNGCSRALDRLGDCPNSIVSAGQHALQWWFGYL